MSSFLEIYLGPLLPQLLRADVTDLYINQAGEVWIETLGGGTERHDVPELTDEHLWRLARQIASITHQGVSREHPLLAATLQDGARVQIVAPPATRQNIAVAIRKHISSDLTLDDYQAQGAFADTRPRDAGGARMELAAFYEKGDWAAFLKAAVRARKTILVAGGTSTGKTTFANALIQEIPREERLIYIEDTPELVLRHPNALGLLAVRGQLGEAAASTDDLLIASLRMRPDRIILGELRGREAFTFLRAIKTGHPGSLTTLHADSPAAALDQLALLILQAQAGLQRESVLLFLRNVVDIVVQLERRSGLRRVSQIAWWDADAP